jgi:hypothetical protein
VNFSHILEFEILGCDKPTPLKMNLVLKIRTDRKRNSEFLHSILLLSLLILNESMNLGESLPHTLKTSQLSHR